MATVVVQLSSKSDDFLFEFVNVTRERGDISTEG